MAASTLKPIRSVANPQFKLFKKIAASSRARREHGWTLLDGTHLILACADAGLPLAYLIVRDGNLAHGEIQQCLRRFPDTPSLLLSADLFNALSPVQHPAGVLGVMAIPTQQARAPACAVLLENIQDPGNLGAILRTAAAAGAEAAYLNKGCAEAWSPKVLRAAMGAHFLLDVYEAQPLAEVAAQFETSLAMAASAAHSLYDVDLRSRIGFLFGNEGAGLSAELRAAASHTVYIPMPGKIESLNVAAAAAICLYERVRQLARETKPD